MAARSAMAWRLAPSSTFRRMRMEVSRADGWSIDMTRSTASSLIWIKVGEKDIRWDRQVSPDGPTPSDALVADTQSEEKGDSDKLEEDTAVVITVEDVVTTDEPVMMSPMSSSRTHASKKPPAPVEEVVTKSAPCHLLCSPGPRALPPMPRWGSE